MKTATRRGKSVQPKSTKTADLALKRVVSESQTVAARFIEEYENLNRLCESPIETMMLASMFCEMRYMVSPAVFIGNFVPGDLTEKNDCPVFISQQVDVGNYRVDFLVHDFSCGNPCQKIVVECDGHDFHERTKEQAARDKARDRYMQSEGYKVLRFTGSEIYKDADSCAQEIISNLKVEAI